MPKKPQKWGFKIWCLAESTSKYIYNFDIYCGQNFDSKGKALCSKRKSTVTYEVVMKLSSGLNYFRHCKTMDNCFISILLFIELASKGIYVMGTL